VTGIISMPTPAQEPDGPSAWPGATQGLITTVLLALASMGSQFDRTVVNLTVGPLKATFSLDDTHFAMLQGMAFGIFYITACIPIGALADRYQRRLIIATGLGFFSLFAVGSGLARNYLQLFLTRIGVAVGEATLTPAGLSMLSDLYPPNRLGRPVSAFLMSAPVAFIIGGKLLYWLTNSPAVALGPLSHLAPWQNAFIIVGAPFLLLVPLFLLQREPKRHGPGGDLPLTVPQVLEVVRSRSRALIPMFAGFAMVSLVSYTFFIWTPAFMQRTYGWDTGRIGVAFGLITLVCGTGGVFFAGWLSDRLASRGKLDAHLRVAAYGFIGCGFFGALALLMPTATAALAMLAPAIFLSMMPYPCAGTAIQLVVPNRARAQLTAMYVTLTTLVGLVVGPLIVGLMTDRVFHDPAQIRYSLAIVVGIAAPTMFVLLLSAFRPYRALRVS